MQETHAYIEHRSDQLRGHPFFTALRPEPDLKRAMAFAPSAMFWVLSFQDMIRMNAELTQDPSLRQFVEQHLAEDTGHEKWFLEDLEHVFGSAPTKIDWLFSSENYRIRKISFALASEVFRASDDRLRPIVIDALEAGADVCLKRIAQNLVESGHAGTLKYFAGMHLNAEASHAMHSEQHKPQKLELPTHLREEAEALIDRMFEQFIALVDLMHERLEEGRA